MTKETQSTPGGRRLLSLDVLRGFDMFWIIGFGSVLRTLAGMFPQSLGWLGVQMHHVPGGADGFTFCDGIFPLFLFMTGASFPFSYASQVKKGLSSSTIHLRLARRALVLVLLSFLHNGILQFSCAEYHYNSVLQRLGLTWFFTALLWMHCRPRTRIVLGTLALVGYQIALCDWGYGLLDVLDGWFAPRGWFPHDPFEVHDLPLSVLQFPLCLLGMFAGDAVRAPRDGAVAARLAVLGAVFSAAGLAMHFTFFPINKNLATPSNTLFFGGTSLLAFALFHYAIDLRGVRFGTGFFRVIGVNSIAAYLLPTVLPVRGTAKFLFGGIASLGGAWSGLINDVGFLAVVWFILWFLDRHDIRFKA